MGFALHKMAPFGVEIVGIDLATASDEALDEVVEVFHRNGAIVIRGQQATPEDLVRFVNRFGEPQKLEARDYRNLYPGVPQISILSNRVVDGKPIGAHNAGVGWHTDMSFAERPAMCTMLYAVEVPDEGSDTLLADGVAAYQALSREERDRIDGLSLRHSRARLVETKQYNPTKLTDEQRAAYPEVTHPLVRTHPADGRRALWPSTGSVIEVIGMPNPDGLQLVDDLVEFMTQDRFVYRHKWQVGDILMWDNRCSLHTGTTFDDSKYIRTMYRLWVQGDKPY